MKNLILIILLLFSTNFYSQNKDKKSLLDEMNNYFNKGKIEKLEELTNDLLSGKYGNMDDELKFYALMYSSNVYSRDEYVKKDPQIGYDKTIELINFTKTTSYQLPNKESYLKSMDAFLVEFLKKHPEIIKTSNQNTSQSNTQSTLSSTTNTENKAPTSDNKTVTLTVSGTGKTIEEAKLNALHSAIKQAFETFISSKTEILNDILIKDEIVSISNGTIEKYDIISQIEIPNNGYVLTLNTTVSIEKLTTFLESKGVAVEFKGGMFAQKIKLQKLNESAEEISVKNLCQASFEILLNSIDYNLSISEPSQIGEIGSQYHYDLIKGLYIKEYNPDDYKIEFKVAIKSNNNLLLFYENFKKTISALSMSESEKLNYEKLNKKVILISIGNNNYFLRNTKSAEVLNIFFMKMNLIPSLFEIKYNLENYNYLLANRNEVKEEFNFLNNYNGSKSQGFHDYANASNVIASCENIYPFFNDLFASYSDVIKENKSQIYSQIKHFRHGYFSLESLQSQNLGYTDNYGYSFLIGTKEFDYTINFNRFFTINEIEKIDKFEIEKIDLLNSLKKEQDRIKNTKKIILYNMGYSGYVPENYILELNDKKYECKNYCNYEIMSSPSGYFFDLIEKNKDFYIVKSIDPYTNSPGKLYKLKPSKEIIKKED